MNKYLKPFVNSLPVVIIMALLFIPIPTLVLVIMYAVLWLLCGLCLVGAIKGKEMFKTLPRKMLFLSLWILGTEISFTRTILDGQRSGLYKYVAALNFNYIVNIIVGIALVIALNILVNRGLKKPAEVCARFALDTMSQKFFDIDNQVSTGEITQESAAQKKDEIRKDIDFCSNMDGSSRLLAGTTNSLIFIYLVCVIAGCIVRVMNNELSIIQALQESSFLALLNVLLFAVPVLLLAIAGMHAIRR
ncbi:MAG: FHIPEP family type III secretion protein [Treponema sp.]|nr:FHIPEP family type III secretion protein [Treponema sp.]